MLDLSALSVMKIRFIGPLSYYLFVGEKSGDLDYLPLIRLSLGKKAEILRTYPKVNCRTNKQILA